MLIKIIFFRAISLDGHEGVLVTKKDAPLHTVIHEYYHVRDFSVALPTTTYDYSVQLYAYELLTDLRTLLAAQASYPGGRLAHMVGGAEKIHALLSPFNPAQDMPTALQALLHYAGMNRELEGIISGAIHYPFRMHSDFWRFSRGNAKCDAMSAFFDMLAYVTECERQNPPISSEIRPEVMRAISGV